MSYFLPGDLEAAIGDFAGHYKLQRHRESLKNLTPADSFCGRGQTILFDRDKINWRIFKERRMQHAESAA